MYIKESELRALVRQTFSKLIKEDAEGLGHKNIARTAANFLASKYGESLSFMQQDELKRKILDAVIDQMRNAKMKGKEVAMKIFTLTVQELSSQGILKNATAKPSTKDPVVPPINKLPKTEKPSDLQGKGSNLQIRNLQKLFRGNR